MFQPTSQTVLRSRVYDIFLNLFKFDFTSVSNGQSLR